jgi:hypothetical protein
MRLRQPFQPPFTTHFVYLPPMVTSVFHDPVFLPNKIFSSISILVISVWLYIFNWNIKPLANHDSICKYATLIIHIYRKRISNYGECVLVSNIRSRWLLRYTLHSKRNSNTSRAKITYPFVNSVMNGYNAMSTLNVFDFWGDGVPKHKPRSMHNFKFKLVAVGW